MEIRLQISVPFVDVIYKVTDKTYNSIIMPEKLPIN
jgi:hypothetical protein